MALSGQGADELLGGYRKHRAAALVGSWQRIRRVPRARGGDLAAAGSGRACPARPAASPARSRAADPVERLLATSGQLDRPARRARSRRRSPEVDGGAARRAIAGEPRRRTDDPLPAMLYLDGSSALVDDMLHYFDRASMAHSLEVRVPFLDHHLVEFCATIPAELKVGAVHRRRSTC